MNRTSVEAIGLVLATLNLDDVYPELRELLREVLADAKNCNCERYKLSEACYTAPQTKPLSADEIKEAFNQWLMLDEGVARFDYQLKHTWVAEQWERWQKAFKSAEVLK